MEDRVIHDNECREYREGWNACNEGKLIFANPYSGISYDGELYRLWSKGHTECQAHWDDADLLMPVSYSESDLQKSFSITNSK